MKNLLLISLSFLCLNVFSQNITIKGVAPGYNNKELRFFTYSDLITEFEQELNTVTTDSKGGFEFTIQSFTTQKVFTHYGVYNACFYIEPDRGYQLILPEYESKTKKDELNPFYEESKIHVGVITDIQKDLNYYIATFDNKYMQVHNQILFDTYGKPDKKEDNHVFKISKGENKLNVDSLIEKLSTYHTNTKNNYYKNYKDAKIAFLKSSIGSIKDSELHYNFILERPITYSNPAYIEILSKIYDGYLVASGKTDKAKNIYGSIHNKSLYSLKKTLKDEGILQKDSLIELVILNNLHKEFYDDNFSRLSMLSILDSIYFTTKIIEHSLIAQNIREKVTKLLVGFFPPKFDLYNFSNELININKYKGKYVYINFCSTYSYSCLQDFELLRTVKKKFGQYLEIVSITIDEDMEAAKKLIEREKYDWDFLHYGNQPSIIKEFDIRVFPTYFMLDREGKLLMSPAPTPSEDLDKRFFRFLRDRNEIIREKKTIFPQR